MKAWKFAGVILFSVFMGGVKHATAQLPGLYLDFGLKSGFFFARELENIRQGQAGLAYRLGVGFWKSENAGTVLSAELFGGVRNLSRQYGSNSYSLVFNAPGLFLVGSHALNDNWKLEGGLGFSAISSNPAAFSSNLPLIAADDFRQWDVLLAAGAEFQITKVLSVIARAEWGFVPMLNYQPIGDFGELEEPYNDLFYRSIQVCMRFNFIQK